MNGKLRFESGSVVELGIKIEKKMLFKLPSLALVTLQLALLSTKMVVKVVEFGFKSADVGRISQISWQF